MATKEPEIVDKPCRLCGGDTYIDDGPPGRRFRRCEECDWWIEISGPASVSDKTEMRQRIEELEQKVDLLMSMVDADSGTQPDDLGSEQ